MMNIQTFNGRVVNLYKEPYDVYIGRSGKGKTSLWGNPFSVKEYGHDACIEKFREYITERLESEPALVVELSKLKGKTLGCFCKPKACHGDVILEMIERYCNE